MLIDEYDIFVGETDLNRDKGREHREDIAIYGAVGEMGALTSAVKRRLIAEEHGQPWNLATDEVVEELGDALWYWAVLTNIYDAGPGSMLKRDVFRLAELLTASTEDGHLFREAVGSERVELFKLNYRKFVDSQNFNLNEYQEIAYLTRRTHGKMFVGVCLTVLSQLGAELLRLRFPEVESQINTVITKRPITEVLREISWHLAAIASVYNLKLSEITRRNRVKINKRLNKSKHTPLPDDRYPNHEKFPRKFEISFVMVGRDRSRMYLSGRRLGDELGDNSHSNDGYRFHDVLHLAVLANLGWSPVLRSLMKKKRKSNPKTDDVEDGARAIIVEEAVVKAIHSEGERVSAPRLHLSGGDPVPLFVGHAEITFQFLGFIDNLTKGLEVAENQYWEWERAILQASEVFFALRKEEQGTVTVDLENRSISFVPEVYVDGPGIVVGAGSALLNASKFSNPQESELAATKEAILKALDLNLDENNLEALNVKPYGQGVSVKASVAVREAIWRKKVISFQTMISRVGNLVSCTALGVADPRDTVS
jgi:NTP pyrophosphatase (non-canonical NTP hydrolase)